MPYTTHAAPLADLSPRTAHDIFKLRVDVFVVEQDCPYAELDGLDTEPGTIQLWVEADGEVAATLRILAPDGEDAAYRIGRVATVKEHRGRGYAAALMTEALWQIGERPVVLGAQAYVQGWYERFGFTRDGDDYLEDGIPHLPMRR